MQSIHFNNFVPPSLEPIWAPKSFVFLFINALTFGIYGAAETISKNYRIKELNIIQADLQNQVAALGVKWNDLEKELHNLLKKAESSKGSNGDDKKLTQTIQTFRVKKLGIEGKSVEADYEIPPSIAEIALGTITFVGQLLANISTLFLYGVYQNYSLKNSIAILEAQNLHLKTQFDSHRDVKEQHIEQILILANDVLKGKKELADLGKTDVGIEHQKAVKAQKEAANLKKEQKDLQQQVSALKIQKNAFENLEREVKNLRGDKQNLENEKYRLRQEKDLAQNAKDQKDLELQQLRAQKNKEIGDLNNQLYKANQKGNRVEGLEREVARMQDIQNNQPELARLQGEVGPIPPKYAARKEDGEIPGADDIVKNDDDGKVVDPEVLAHAKDYQKRYEGKRSAAAIVDTAFNYVFPKLLDMAATGDKIKLNDSVGTPASPGAQAVYRCMVLDWLKGGKVYLDGCHGYALAVNGDVSMYPSHPEKVLHYKYEAGAKKYKPEVVLRYTQRDDFTPTEDGLGLRDGVDAVSAKWIFQQLTKEEQDHLFNLLMSPVIENSHPDLQKTKEFMAIFDKRDAKKEDLERAALVRTAYELIADMGTAIQKKFGPNALIPCWRNNVDALDVDKQPFVKVEDAQPDLNKIVDTDLIQNLKGKGVVDWELDLDVLGDKRSGDAKPRQEDFADLISFSRAKYATVFNHMSRDLLVNPMSEDEEGEEIKNLTFEHLNPQYHVSHQMLGSDQYANGGQRCLFSNLLAILINDYSALHLKQGADNEVKNVLKLKKAMAAYLDKLQDAKRRWVVIKNQNQPVLDAESKKLKELAELFSAFEQSISKTHKCTVSRYQAWLRDENGAPNINISSLTPFEIQLGAYTIGVKIGLFTINVDGAVGKVDEYGKIIPVGDYLGPNTKECLYMGCTNGTYYGLFPKLNLGSDEVQNAVDQDDLNDLMEIEQYWNQAVKAR